MKTLSTKRLSRFGLVVLSAHAVCWPGFARADTLRVPEDYATIGAAVAAAADGDTIRVGPGAYCELVMVNKRLNLQGEGGPTIGDGLCPAGIRIAAEGSGTTIRHFIFLGSLPQTALVAIDASNGVIEQNTFLVPGRVIAVRVVNGRGWTVNHNRFEGFRVAAVEFFSNQGRALVNTAMFNVVIAGSPLVMIQSGIVLVAQDGAVVTNNHLVVPDSQLPSGAAVTAAGIRVTDFRPFPATNLAFVTTRHAVMVNNDGRDSEFAVLVSMDRSGGNGNLEGMILRGNFGLNNLAGAIDEVTNRSIDTLVECDEEGSCTAGEPPPGP